MIKHFLKITFRNIKKHLVISFLNISGLAIGIRKTNGAETANILVLISIDFTKWVLIANLIAWP